MKIFGIIAVLSAFLTVDANRQCRSEMTTLFGKADKKAHHKKFRVLCAQSKGFLDGSCDEKPKRVQSRCTEAKKLLDEIMPKFEELEESKCLNLVARVCSRPEEREDEQEEAEVEETEVEEKEEENEEAEEDEKQKPNKGGKGNRKEKFQQALAAAQKLCEEKNRCKLFEKLNERKEKFQKNKGKGRD